MKITVHSKEHATRIVCAALSTSPYVTVTNTSGYVDAFEVDFDETVFSEEELRKVLSA